MKKDKILIISGTHGNEMSAVQAGLKLKKYFKDNNNVKVIPFLNETGLVNNSRESVSFHTKDLNRSFQEEYPKYDEVVTKVEELVAGYDYIIDIHNSYRCSNFCLVDIGKNERKITSLCHSAGVEYATRYSKGGTIKDYCNQYGKIGITYEFSGMSTLNNSKELEIAVNDIISLVNHITLDGVSKAPIQNLRSIHCLTDGFIDFKKDINNIAKPGEVLFNVLDENSKIIETVKNEYKNYNMKLMALDHSFQCRGSSVLQYIRKEHV